MTHGHFDHFLAAGAVKKALGDPPICLGRADLPLWRALPIQCAMLGMAAPAQAPGDPDVLLDDQHELALLGGRCIHTPGHSPGQRYSALS